jgi:hypothetical protein
LHKNFGCYNFAYQKDTKTPVIGYRTKWPTGWTNEWFYVKVDEKRREKLMSLSEIDRIIASVEPGRDTKGAIAPESLASKGKKTEEASSENRSFDLRHLGGQQLSEEDISELKEFAVSGGYQPGSVLFGAVDKEILGCIPDRAGAKILNTLAKSIEFPKLERDISN